MCHREKYIEWYIKKLLLRVGCGKHQEFRNFPAKNFLFDSRGSQERHEIFMGNFPSIFLVKEQNCRVDWKGYGESSKWAFQGGFFGGKNWYCLTLVGFWIFFLTGSSTWWVFPDQLEDFPGKSKNPHHFPEPTPEPQPNKTAKKNTM